MKTIPDCPLEDDGKGYRQHYLLADIKLSRRIILAWLVVVAIFIPVDYIALGPIPEFYLILFVRLLFSVGIVGIFISIHEAITPRKFDLLIGLILLLGAAFDFLGTFLYPQDYLTQIIIGMFVIFTIYVVFPGPLMSRLIVCAFISGKTIWLILIHKHVFSGGLVSLGTIILITNLLGYYSWRAMTNFRQQQYAAEMELNKAKNRAEYLARTDSLTGVNNRRAFTEFGTVEFLRSLHYQRPLSLALIDIDNFKPLNDRYGHHMGDSILQLFSETVRKAIRDQDILGRIGGDEFALMLPETSIQDAQKIVMRLGVEFRNKTVLYQNEKISTSFSAGVATLQSSDQSFEELLERADQKLYLAKNTGRKRVVA